MTDYKIKDTAFYSGEDVLAEDLGRTSSGVGEEICTRFRDMVNSIRMGTTVASDQANYSGIWHDSRDTSNFPYTNFSGSINYDFHLTINATINATHNYLIDVGKVGAAPGPSGVAYDTLGRRIAIATDNIWDPVAPAGNPTQSTGNIGIDLNGAGGSDTNGVVNYLYIRWLEVRNPAVVSIHPIDGSTQYIGRENGYIISAVVGAGADPDSYLPAHLDYVYIGKITAQGSGVSLVGYISDDDAYRYYLAVDARHVKARTPITISDRPAVYAPDKIVTLEDHIRAVDAIANVSNTNPHGLTGDSKVKADNTDPTAGYLDAKVDGVSVFVNPTTHQMYAVATGSSDHKVIGDIGDTSPDYLDGKVDNSTIYVTGHKLTVKPGGITTTQIANNTIIHANMATYDAVGGPIIRKGHLDNVNDTTSIANLVNGGNADAFHYHTTEKAFIENSTYTFADYATAVGGGEELAFSVTVPTKIGQQITVIWYCLNGSGNPNPSARESAIRLKITEGALALDHTVLTGAAGTSATPLPAIEMETIRATTNGGTLIQCYTQYTGTVPGSGWSVVNANRLSVLAAPNV